MYALIAAVIAIAVIAMMWRFLDAEVARRSAEDDDPLSPERRRPREPWVRPQRRAPQTRTLAPDDDPDFLRELGRRISNERDDGQPA